ncbi:MAG: GPW/gp25 family protein [Chloroflexi bacterium]|nr:GPW/gp25 family protein [Chloroflexota bacterium]
MDEGKLFGRGISFPPRIGADGRLAWSAGAENIRESIRIILQTLPQERIMLPEFGAGLEQYLFEPNAVSTHRLLEEEITQALQRWERRIRLESVRVEADPDDPQAAVAVIRYRLVATGANAQVSLALKLSG